MPHEMADTYEVELDDGKTVDVLELVDKAVITPGKKIQLKQFHPIDESIALTTGFPEGATATDRRNIIQTLGEYAWDQVERDIVHRYEMFVKKEAFNK